jgi:hypothetical protein
VTASFSHQKVQLRAQSPSPGTADPDAVIEKVQSQETGVTVNPPVFLRKALWYRSVAARLDLPSGRGRATGERPRGALQFLSGHPLDRHFIHGHLTDSREKAFRPGSIWCPVFLHERLKEPLLHSKIGDSSYRAKRNHAPVSNCRVALKPTVVKDLTRLVDLEAAPSLMVNIYTQMTTIGGVVDE